MHGVLLLVSGQTSIYVSALLCLATVIPEGCQLLAIFCYATSYSCLKCIRNEGKFEAENMLTGRLPNPRNWGRIGGGSTFYDGQRFHGRTENVGPRLGAILQYCILDRPSPGSAPVIVAVGELLTRSSRAVKQSFETTIKLSSVQNWSSSLVSCDGLWSQSPAYPTTSTPWRGWRLGRSLLLQSTDRGDLFSPTSWSSIFDDLSTMFIDSFHSSRDIWSLRVCWEIDKLIVTHQCWSFSSGFC